MNGKEPVAEVAVVVPTYDERENIVPLVSALTNVLRACEWELIFVDDGSRDGTAERIRDIASTNQRVRTLERVGQRGLFGACVEGMRATSAPYIAVMDADLQHDERALPVMLERIRSEQLDIVIGSRKTPGGGMGDFSCGRRVLSTLGSQLSRLVSHYDVSDPMSGFFMVKRAFFDDVVSRLSGTGFKLLLDLLASASGPIRLGEVPYQFRSRRWGKSKLNLRIEFQYLSFVMSKLTRNIITRP
jgi:dolichol-phosphate mannosyltransferase